MKWILFRHARSLRLGELSRLSQAQGRRYSDSQLKAKWQPRLLLRRSLGTFVVAGVVYAVYGYLAAEDDQGKKFEPYLISEKTFCSSTSSILKLKSQKKVDWSKQWQNGLWSIEIKQPQLQIAREYTPLPPEVENYTGSTFTSTHDHHDQGALEFWIRREAFGEVSNYLHKLKLNDSVEVRGPKTQTAIPKAQEFVFIAGGTGIAPAIQLAHALLARHTTIDDLPKVSILWANRNRQDCLGGTSDTIKRRSSNLMSRWFTTTHTAQVNSEKAYLVARLDLLKKAFSGKMRVDYYVDKEGSRIGEHDIFSHLNTREGDTTSNSKRVVMVCGPDGFVAHFAGPKQWSNGQQVQGQIAGVLRDAGNLGWDVMKL